MSSSNNNMKSNAPVVRKTTTVQVQGGGTSKKAKKRAAKAAGIPATTTTTTTVSAKAGPSFAKPKQPHIRDVASQMSDYVRCVIDPFNTPPGTKVPDAIVYPSTTFEIRQNFDLSGNADGEFAIIVQPWFAIWYINNQANPYLFKDGVKVDSAQAAAIRAQFSGCRPVAAGCRVTYAGSALNASGLLGGALSDPFQPMPGAFEDLLAYPEYAEFSVSGESAGMEVFWKPMSLYNNEYHSVNELPAPPGLVAAYYPNGVATNVAIPTRAVWLQSSTTANIGNQVHPYMVIAGKGLPANCPLKVELIAHFEATVRSATLLVGSVKPTVSHLNHSAMEQASVVIPQMNAARKPRSEFLGKAANIVKEFGSVLLGGMSPAGMAGSVIRNMFMK